MSNAKHIEELASFARVQKMVEYVLNALGIDSMKGYIFTYLWTNMDKVVMIDKKVGEIYGKE